MNHSSNQPGPYLTLVKSHLKRWPSFKLLIDFNKSVQAHSTRVAVLEFHPTHVTDLTFTDPKELEEYWATLPSRSPCKGRLYLLEDLSAAYIEEFGNKFHIDPSVFVEYLSYDPDKNQNSLDEYYSIRRLPSIQQQSTHSTIVYHEVRQFPFNAPRTEEFEILTCANVPRLVTTIDYRRHGKFSGLVRRNFSFWLHCAKPGTDQPWDVLMLLDPKITDQFAIRRWRQPRRKFVACTSKSYLGGYLSVSPWNALNPSDSDEFFPLQRTNMFDDIIHYWKFDATSEEINATLSDPIITALFAIKIIASMWNLMLEYLTGVVSKLEQGLLHFEQMTGQPSAQTIRQEVDTLRVLLVDVNAWRRRLWFYLEQTKYNLETIGEPILDRRGSQRPQVPLVVDEKLAGDFRSIYERLLLCRDRIQSLMPVVMGAFSLLEAQHSGLQNKSVIGLSVIALIFVPLSLAGSLLGMSDSYLPGQPRFWVFFSISIPLIFVLFLWLFRAEAKIVWRWLLSNVSKSRLKEPLLTA